MDDIVKSLCDDYPEHKVVWRGWVKAFFELKPRSWEEWLNSDEMKTDTRKLIALEIWKRCDKLVNSKLARLL